MTINTDLKDYLTLNIINSDNWTLRYFHDKITKTLPINDVIRFAIYSLYPEVEEFFRKPFPNTSFPQVSFQLNGYTFFLVRREDYHDNQYFYITQNAV